MNDINLNEAVILDVCTLAGDTFGPILFQFQTGTYDCTEGCENCDDTVTYNQEDLRGAIFEGELYRGKTLYHRLTTNELVFDDTTSILTFQLTASFSTKLANTSLKVVIRQILNDIVTTRVTGVILFSNTLNIDV